MKKKKGKKINREKLIKNIFFSVSVATILVLSLYLVELYTQKYRLRQEDVLGTAATMSPESKDTTFWRDYLQKYPNYFPGWMELANLELESGNFDEFLFALDKADKLNPNSYEVKELKFRYNP